MQYKPQKEKKNPGQGNSKNESMQYPRAYEKIPNIMTTWEDVDTDTENDKVGKRTKERVN